MITTRWVLMEVADALAASACRNKVAAFIAALEADATRRLPERVQASFNAGWSFTISGLTKSGR